jgi:hypothetical protein
LEAFINHDPAPTIITGHRNGPALAARFT